MVRYDRKVKAELFLQSEHTVRFALTISLEQTSYGSTRLVATFLQRLHDCLRQPALERASRSVTFAARLELGDAAKRNLSDS